MGERDHDQLVVFLDDDDVEGESIEQQSLRAKGACFTWNSDEGERVFPQYGEGALEGIEKPRTGSGRLWVRTCGDRAARDCT